VEFDHQMTTLNFFTDRLPALLAAQLGTMRDVKALVTVSRDWKTSVIVACREDARLREVVEKSCKCNTALTGQSEKDKLVWMRRVQPDHRADEIIDKHRHDSGQAWSRHDDSSADDDALGPIPSAASSASSPPRRAPRLGFGERREVSRWLPR
jgi:hypothetical protein